MGLLAPDGTTLDRVVGAEDVLHLGIELAAGQYEIAPCGRSGGQALFLHVWTVGDERSHGAFLASPFHGRIWIDACDQVQNHQSSGMEQPLVYGPVQTGRNTQFQSQPLGDSAQARLEYQIVG